MRRTGVNVDERQAGDHSLDQPRPRIAEHPDVSQRVVGRVGITQRVDQNTDQRKIARDHRIQFSAARDVNTLDAYLLRL
jgi:hypothetical protein